MGLFRVFRFESVCFVGLLLMFAGGARGQDGGVLCDDDRLGMIVESSAYEIVVDGDRVYVMVGLEGLRIYDVSDPIAPVLVGSYPETGRIVVDGDRVYIARDYGIDVLDVSDPAAPVSLGFFQGEEYLTFPLNGWELVGDVIYMASSQVGLMLFDVSDPANIVQLETYGGFLEVYGVLQANGHLYVNRNGLEVLDVSDPRSPVLAHTLDWMNLYQKSDASGSLMYLVDSERFSIFDISNPSEMNLVGSVAMNISHWFYQNVHVADGRAYLSTDGSVEVIDVADPANPAYLGTYSILNAHNTQTIDDIGYVASGDGLHILDVSNPGTPEVGFVETVGAARSVVVDRGLAYIADAIFNQSSLTSGLRIVDVSDPTAPELIGSINLIGPTWDLVVDQDLVYTADGYFGFHIVDVSQPELPVVIGGYDTERETIDLDVKDGVVYVADAFSFLIFDASDPSNIELLAAEDIKAQAVMVRSGIAYVAEDRIGVHAFDVSDPSSPILLGSYIPKSFYSNSYGYGLELVGDELFVVGSGFGLKVLDVNDPSFIQLVSERDIFRPLNHGIAVEGRTAYVVDDRFGLQILDLDAQGGPSRIGSYHVPWGAEGVFVADGLAYVVDGDGGGLHIVDITDSCNGCSADMNGDGSLNFFDVSAFLAAFAAMEPAGDFDGDGSFNFFDVSAFLVAFGEGCS
ncbi:MAG: hypothetical protein JKX70_10060 [Phycisphaerales bacterium]|nr:hypothetical protein [Phycisphaerales bacterium]